MQDLLRDFFNPQVSDAINRPENVERICCRKSSKSGAEKHDTWALSIKLTTEQKNICNHGDTKQRGAEMMQMKTWLKRHKDGWKEADGRTGRGQNEAEDPEEKFLPSTQRQKYNYCRLFWSRWYTLKGLNYADR